VRFILRHERSAELFFCAQQSAIGQEILREHAFPAPPESLVLIEQGQVFTEASAAFALCRYLRFPWRAASVFRFLPAVLTRAAYRWIARNRLRFFGKQQACDLPSPAEAARFLS
jgi:predicted DCC family thiol-disulfide oxidoreductase YuxK